MSRIGKRPIQLPEQTRAVVDGNTITVQGPKGELARTFRNDEVSVSTTDDEVRVEPRNETIQARALWGTYASHIQNMVHGVNQLFEKTLVIEGVGYRAEVSGNELVLSVGFSHQVRFPIPEGIDVAVEKSEITVKGIDKELVGSFAARVRASKTPEPYKGKGIHYSDEVVRRKEGKKAA